MIPFADSAQSTLGVEWEVALVDQQSRELASRAQEVFQVIEAEAPYLLDPASTEQGKAKGAHITGEFLDNTIELVTGVSQTPEEAVQQLQFLAEALRNFTGQLGLEFFSAGTHPFSKWADQPVADKERYQKIIDRTQYWGRQMIIYGVHVHTGVNARAKALPVLDGLTNFYPHLLALSANSPYWEGTDTGFASHRSQLFQQLPTSGLPFHFDTWEAYEKYLGDMIHTGVIDEPSENRWDIRPVPHYGTVEMRVCDGLASMKEIAAITAFNQCLVESFSRTLDAGQRIEPLVPWHVQENKWRAARYGTDAIIILNNQNEEELVTDHLRNTVLNQLEPIAQDLGCARELALLEMLMDEPGYKRQRAIAQASSGDLCAVVDDLVAQGKEQH